jgi:predicted DsbA family dithiol-disulfide isomerase
MSNPNPMQPTLPLVQVAVYVDFCCPWCLIGLTHLDEAAALLRGKVVVETVFHPFELDPTAPESGVDIRRKLREKHGINAEDVWPQIESVARASGIPLALAKVPYAYPSTAAHALVKAAATRGQARQVARALIEAYFLQARSIADLDVLCDLAEKNGVDRALALEYIKSEQHLATVHREAEQARRSGIRSVPTLVIGGTVMLSASQPPRALADAMRERSR